MVAVSGSERPRLRGVSHQLAAMVWPVLGAALVLDAEGGRAMAAKAVYAVSATALFAVSALYHRVTWAPAARQRMRRLDHSAIFVLIAGTYTPLCMLALDPADAVLPLAVVWVGAGLGVVKALVWVGGPKWVTAALAVVVGWAPWVEGAALYAGLGAAGVGWVVAGGVLYTGGALVYARRWPDPWPRTFGYHEVFHAMVVAAALCHLVVVARLV